MREINRPLPLLAFISELAPYIRIMPAEGVYEWVQGQIIADGGNLYNPDHFHLADVYADPEGKTALQKEELIASEREGVLDGDVITIAILNEDFESPENAKRKAFDGLRYQFIYPGDQVYVMNSNGSTIETVK